MECLVSCAGVGLCFFVLYFLLKSYRYKQKITQFGDKYVLITGCDSGFGNRFAKRLDVLGFHVFAACLTEKGKSDLTSTCSKNVVPFIMDVSRDESIEQGRQEVAKQLPSDKGRCAFLAKFLDSFHSYQMPVYIPCCKGSFQHAYRIINFVNVTNKYNLSFFK